jgi:hypothetical protein
VNFGGLEFGCEISYIDPLSTLKGVIGSDKCKRLEGLPGRRFRSSVLIPQASSDSMEQLEKPFSIKGNRSSEDVPLWIISFEKISKHPK